MTAAAGEPLLSIRNLSIQYGSGAEAAHAVNDVSLDLSHGEIVGLAGESGSGKSTLAYGATRLLRAPAVITGGSAVYTGSRSEGRAVDLLAATPAQLRALRWADIAIVFQSAMNALNPVLTVGDQIDDVLEAHTDLDRRARRTRSGELLEIVGIPRDRLGSYPHQLSGGMRQRAMIGMALALRPDVVIMDEPTTALDVVMQREIIHQIRELQADLGFAVLFITHDLSLLLEMANRIAVMYAGRLVEVGTSDDVYRRPSHPYTRGLLSSFPSVHGERRVLSGIPGSPPDLRRLPEECNFAPRCTSAVPECLLGHPTLLPVHGERTGRHLAACVRTSGEHDAPPLDASPAGAEAPAPDTDPVPAGSGQ